MEVPEAAGYANAGCLPNRLWVAFHRWPDIYTAPGTWPGGSSSGLPIWIAGYGVRYAPRFLRCPVAWQFASPPYGYYYFPQIGYGDVSVDYGMLKQVPPPPSPPRLVCFGPKAQLRNATCKRVRAEGASQSRGRDSAIKTYRARGCSVFAGRIRSFEQERRGPPPTRREPRRRALLASLRAFQQQGCQSLQNDYLRLA